MPGIPLPDLTPEQEEIYNLFPINLTRMMLYTKCSTLPYLKFSGSFREAALPAQTREQVIARVGTITGSEYELLQHKVEVLRTGSSQEVLEQITDPDRTDFGDPALTALMAYVDSAVKDHRASDASLTELRKYFADNLVAEITFIASQYLMTAVFILSLNVPLDDGPVDWAASTTKMAGA